MRDSTINTYLEWQRVCMRRVGMRMGDVLEMGMGVDERVVQPQALYAMEATRLSEMGM